MADLGGDLLPSISCGLIIFTLCTLCQVNKGADVNDKFKQLAAAVSFNTRLHNFTLVMCLVARTSCKIMDGSCCAHWLEGRTIPL